MFAQEFVNIDISKLDYKPEPRLFPEVTLSKLLASCWRIFWRTQKLQGWKGALRVFPIVWTIIVAIRGFSRFHAQEYERMALARANKVEADLTLTETERLEYQRLGAWLRDSLSDLGPTFIKIGQTLATRADLLPLPAMLELTQLQENVPVYPTELAFQAIERELGGTPDVLFAQFNSTPIAAASLCQAYKAKLHDGRDVIVKVQRPGLSKIISGDIEVLAFVAQEIMLYPSLSRHTDWPGVNEEFARTIFEEIDYIQEGRNADRFRHNFRTFDRIYIPRIIWRLTGRRVLTIEFIDGVRVDDTQTLAAYGIDREEIVTSGANFYLRQLLEDGFFHADPHPGNLRIMKDGRVGIFDFGMVGRISEPLKKHLVQALLHVIQRRYLDLVDDFIAMGFVTTSVDRHALAADLTPIIDTRFSNGMDRVRFREMLFDFSEVVWRYPFRLPSEFTFVMRALLTLEGVALTIHPSFNFMDAAVPYCQRLVLKQQGESIRSAIIKEVFTDGKFNRKAAMKLVKAAAKLSPSSLGGLEYFANLANPQPAQQPIQQPQPSGHPAIIEADPNIIDATPTPITPVSNRIAPLP